MVPIAPRSRMLSVWHLLGKANNKPLRLGLATPLKDAVEGDEGGLGGSLPLGHLRRGVIIPWVNLSVTGNGDPAKGDPGGEAPRPRPPSPSFTGVILALRVTGTSHSPLSAG